MSDITVGMPLEELNERYPDRGFRRPYLPPPEEGGFGVDIRSNAFWTTCIVYIRGDEVSSLIYRSIYLIDLQMWLNVSGLVLTHGF